VTTVTWNTRIAPAFAALIACSSIAAHAEAADPVSRIGAYDDAVIGVMKARLGLAARADRFEPIVRSYYDMPTIAALVVGPGWPSYSAADKSSVIAALTRHSAVSLARNFVSYSDERFVVDPAAIDRAGSKVVRVTIGGSTLFYRMRNAGGSWRIVDAISGGVSQLALQRADLASTVSSGGAPALVRKLAQLDAVK
jgi:phospholipid transport system substrate-binding protein